MAGQIGLEIEPIEDTFKESDLIADSTVNYPILDEIETKFFNKTFKIKTFIHELLVLKENYLEKFMMLKIILQEWIE
jgi:hypothetical protein